MATKTTAPPKKNRMTPPKGGAGGQRRTNRNNPQPANRQTDNQGGLNRIGALWLGKTRTGGGMMSGRIELADGQIRILVFKNSYKENEKHPDYIIYEPETVEEQRNREQQAQGKGRADYDDSDIPF